MTITKSVTGFAAAFSGFALTTILTHGLASRALGGTSGNSEPALDVAAPREHDHPPQVSIHLKTSGAGSHVLIPDGHHLVPALLLFGRRSRSYQ